MCESSSQSGGTLNRTDRGRDVGMAIMSISVLFLLRKWEYLQLNAMNLLSAGRLGLFVCFLTHFQTVCSHIICT